LVDRVDLERALADIRPLAGDEPLCTSSGCEKVVNRVTGGPGLERSMDFVTEELEGLGYSVTVEPWRRGLYSDRNVIARKTGVVSPTEEVYFVAHVDGVAAGAEYRFPAADDNASGTVGGLELARIFADARFARTVVLFFSTGEEQGMQGVKAFLERLPDGGLGPIKYLVNADMIGYDSNDDWVMELYYGDHAPSRALALTMRQAVVTYETRLVPRMDVGCG
jgi:acetylornithine deacetylase/succinyl-diaminopimelate desuccinylase-like protein